MGEIIITTESGTDLRPERARELGIQVIPMYVAMGGNTRADGSFPVSEVFGHFRQNREVPTTSAVNPQEYIEFFKGLRKQFPERQILHIAYTSLASCTYQNAQIALETLQDTEIVLLDSKSVSGGISLLCEKAAELSGTAGSAGELKNRLIPWIDRARVSFLPDTLEYLKAGGRVSNAAYLGASLLKLKPLIFMKEGSLVATKKYRGTMKKVAFEYLEEFISQNDLARDMLYLFYSDGFSEELFEQLKKRACELGFKRVLETQCGCVIACHGGPGALGIAGFAKEG